MLDERFAARMRALLGEEGFLQYEEELSREGKRAFRVNPLKPPSKLPFDISPIPYAENGYYFSDEHIGSHPLHHAGAIYVQEPAAMLPVAALKIEPHHKILDTCASPGGKSSQAASFLGESGFIISNEIMKDRAKVLASNLERLGLKRAVVTSTDVATLTSDMKRFFDLVIVDAPCSGEGMFRKEPDALKNWSPENVATSAERQSEILHNASRAVAGGGRLLYSTCTFSVEENENIVSSFLESHPDFTLIDPKPEVLPYTVAGVGDVRMRRFYPHLAYGEGQFFAIMERSGDERGSFCGESGLLPLSQDEKREVERFLDDILVSYDKSFLYKFKDNIVYSSPDIPVPKGITYSAGVTVGEVKKGYVQPHHQLFSAMGGLFKRKINLSLDDERVKKYLYGESIEGDIENGWVAILVEGVPLGGGKAVDGQIKNHYPKGLRIQH